MGLVHQFSEPFDIAFLQSGDGIDRALIFIYSMFRTFETDGILDQALVRLKFFRCKIAQRIDLDPGLKLGKSFGTLPPPVIVCGIYKAVLYFAVRDNDLRILQFDRSVLIF